MQETSILEGNTEYAIVEAASKHRLGTDKFPGANMPLLFQHIVVFDEA